MRDDSLFKRKKKSKPKPSPEESTDKAQDRPDLQEMRALLEKFGEVSQRMNNAGKNFVRASMRMQAGLEQFRAANEKLKQMRTPNN